MKFLRSEAYDTVKPEINNSTKTYKPSQIAKKTAPK